MPTAMHAGCSVIGELSWQTLPALTPQRSHLLAQLFEALLAGTPFLVSFLKHACSLPPGQAACATIEPAIDNESATIAPIKIARIINSPPVTAPRRNIHPQWSLVNHRDLPISSPLHPSECVLYVAAISGRLTGWLTSICYRLMGDQGRRKLNMLARLCRRRVNSLPRRFP